MKTNLKYTLPLLALAATGALCSCDDDVESWVKNGEPDPKKDLIDFTGTDGSKSAGLSTRASGQGEMISFGGTTNVAMRIKSEGKNTGDVRYTVTEMVASVPTSCNNDAHLQAAGKNGETQAAHDHLNYLNPSAYRYWDDAFGRNAKLSVYAIAVPKQTELNLASTLNGMDETAAPAVSSTNPNWFTESGTSSQRKEDETFVWKVTYNSFQSSSTLAQEDICYSNNIRSGSTEKGVYRYHPVSNTMVFSQMVGDRMMWYGLDNKPGDESTATAGKFDQGHLIFKHALSKITINLTEADNSTVNKGFDNTSPADFKFPTDASGDVTSNVWLIDFPYENKFDLSAGDWKAYDTSTNTDLKIGEYKGLYYNPSNNTEANIQKLTVTGLVLPGKNLYEDTNNSLRFIIDDNEYYVTGKQIAEAIRSYYDTGGAGASDPKASTLKNFTTMKQGEHYEINITVAKSKIDAITAQLVDWEKVYANIADPSNAYVNIQVEERTNTSQYKNYVTDGYTFDLYRSAATFDLNTTVSGEGGYYNCKEDYYWETGYIAGATSVPADKATKSYDNGVWSTGWFWPNNKTFYHFRMVGNTEGNSITPSNVSINKDGTNGDNYAITSGKITGSAYKDYTWAAPFKKNNGAKWIYGPTSNGFDGKDGATDHQIYKAIGATNDKINLMMFHMTSQVFFKVQTKTDNAKVALRTGSPESYNETKVELLYFYKNGIVRVGNGLVLPTTSEELTTNDEFQFVSHTPEVPASGSDPAVSAYSNFQYGVVPQALSGTHNTTPYKVGIRITTPDDNQYVIEDISNVLVATADITSVNLNNPYTESGTGTGQYTIDRWYPGYQYTYTVTIKKTGIENITAQLVDWETVTGDLGEINLEGTN